MRLGSLETRWYGLLFASGFLLSHRLWLHFLKKEHKSTRDLDTLLAYIMLGTLVGARLGHVLFYDLAYYAKHPLEIFLPFTFKPHFRFVGYAGLASHGAAVSIPIAMYLYVNYVIRLRMVPPRLIIRKQRRVGQSYLWLADRMIIVVALTGSLIRIGNFMNSEIIGKPTHGVRGVLFAREPTSRIKGMSHAIDHVKITKCSTGITNGIYQPVRIDIAFKHGNFKRDEVTQFLEHRVKHLLETDRTTVPHIHEPSNKPLQYTLTQNRQGAYLASIDTMGIPRHPAQLYESFSCFLLCLLLFRQWQKRRAELRPGTIFGWGLILIFGLRIIYECFKEGVVVYATMLGPITTPQLLSLPLITVGGILLRYINTRKN